MNQKRFSEALGELDDKYIIEAVRYQKKSRKQKLVKWGAAAACLAIAVIIGSMFLPFRDDMVVSAYAHGTDDEITAAGAVMQSGTISDTGEMKGPPLMFYLSGEDIATVRFSCREQQLNFMDWTEKRAEYGNAQNFTVAYGTDASEYYYLTIDWVPGTIIRELTDNPDSTIASLPENMRNDLIVMEITFADGKTATKAIEISLLDDGTFFASFDDYRISDADAFVRRPDSEAIPREIPFYESEDSLSEEEEIQLNPSYESDNSLSATENLSAVEETARAYYAGTVFTVVSMELKQQTEKKIIFTVRVSKGGVVQEPDRSITLQLNNGAWEVVNEGY